MKNLCFIITTMLSNDLLLKSVESLLKYKQDNFEIIIVDQGDLDTEKAKFLTRHYNKIKYYQVPFNVGLKYSRNFGVQKAKELGGNYIFIGSDSFLFNESIQQINNIIDFLENSEYSFCGFELENSTGGCGWEGKLNLIEGKSFELDFIDKNCPNFKTYSTPKFSNDWRNEDNSPALIGDVIPIWNVDICRNIFIAKIDNLLNVKWDENFKLGGHEDFFWRLKQAGYKGCWTNYIYATKMTDRPEEYAKLRRKNFNDGMEKLKEKYHISGWISYKNIEQAKDYYKKKEG